jgi:hypothetical protein
MVIGKRADAAQNGKKVPQQTRFQNRENENNSMLVDFGEQRLISDLHAGLRELQPCFDFQ